MCGARRLRNESTSTETTPISTAGAGPHSAIASTTAKNAPEIRCDPCRSASRSLTMASASRIATSPSGCQSSASDDAAAATSVPKRIAPSTTSSRFPRAVICRGEPRPAGGRPQRVVQGRRTATLRKPIASVSSGSSRQGARRRPRSKPVASGKRVSRQPATSKPARSNPARQAGSRRRLM